MNDREGTYPFAHGGLPADDGGLDPGVGADGGALEEGGVGETDAVVDVAVGPDGHVGANEAALANDGRGVNQDGLDDAVGLASTCVQLLGGLALQRVQVQAHACQEVLGLPHVHPEALQVHGVELALVGHLGEDLLLDGRRLGLDPLEDGRVEDVDTGVDFVAHKHLWLLHKLGNLSVLLGDHHTILRWLFHFGDLQAQC